MMKPVDWLVSYPKSGNTWVKFLLIEYLERTGNAPQLFADTEEHFFHLASPVPKEELTLEEELLLRPSVVMYAQLLLPSHWYLVKSHHAAEIVGGVPIFPRGLVRKAIYVVRDPRDIVLSLSHHIGGDLEKATRIMTSEGATLQDEKRATHFLNNWGSHVRSWLKSKPFPTCLTTYEQLSANTANVLRNLLSFLGVEEVDEEVVAESVDYCHIDNLRRLEAEGEIDEKSALQDTFFRKGKAGAWRDDLPEKFLLEIEEAFSSTMQMIGYELETTKVKV